MQETQDVLRKVNSLKRHDLVTWFEYLAVSTLYLKYRVRQFLHIQVKIHHSNN